MRIAVTGTPGTGKTTATNLLDTGLEIIHLSELISPESFSIGRDEDRDTLIVDIEGIRDHLTDREDILIESHLAHYLEVDSVIVLRCHPATLETRLRSRNEPASKARENAESEALDLILTESINRHGRDRIYEIDTTNLTPTEVAREITAVITGDREPSAGTVSFVEYL